MNGFRPNLQNTKSILRLHDIFPPVSQTSTQKEGLWSHWTKWCNAKGRMRPNPGLKKQTRGRVTAGLEQWAAVALPRTWTRVKCSCRDDSLWKCAQRRMQPWPQQLVWRRNKHNGRLLLLLQNSSKGQQQGNSEAHRSKSKCAVWGSTPLYSPKDVISMVVIILVKWVS